MIEGCTKHLYLNKDGLLVFQINGIGTLKSKTKLNDGFEHTVAVKHVFKHLTWSLLIDGVQEARLQIVQKTPLPSQSKFKIGVKVINKQIRED